MTKKKIEIEDNSNWASYCIITYSILLFLLGITTIIIGIFFLEKVSIMNIIFGCIGGAIGVYYFSINPIVQKLEIKFGIHSPVSLKVGKK